jgi:hypothetical protein
MVAPSHPDGRWLSGEAGDAVEYLHFDDLSNVFHHELRQDVEPTLEHCKNIRLDQGRSAGRSKSGEWMHAARVDKVVVLSWLNQQGLNWADFKGDVVCRFLNDGNNNAFRLWQGRV